ncbi:hypothetical protein ACHAWF_017046 [Thalassiosira exigua]
MNPPTLHITEQLLTHLGPRYQFSLKGYISTGRLLVFLLLISSAIGARPEWTQVETMTRCNLCLASARIPRKEGDPCFLHVRQLRTRARSGGTTFEGMSTRLRRYRRNIAAGAKNRDVEAKPSSQSFYERLNSPKHILAPMVAQSDLPFRLMCEQLFNVDLSYTQMIHGSNFVEDNGEIFRANHLDVFPQSTVKAILLGESDLGELCVTPSQVSALKGLSGDEVENSRGRLLAAIDRRKGTGMLSEESLQIKPTFVQIAASCPDTAVKAAMMILEKSSTTESYRCGTVPPVMAIDLNLGCPQSIARKGTYGSFLHDESPDLTYQVLSNLRAKLPPEVGVTAKIRLPPTQADADAGKLGNVSQTKAPQSINERIRCLIDCGVDLITVHGRTRFENKVAVGAADWVGGDLIFAVTDLHECLQLNVLTISSILLFMYGFYRSKGAVRQCVETARSYSGDAHYPVFANGGIEFGDDVTKCFETTNASGVMSSESLLEMPSLFSTEGETSSSMTAMQLLERQIGFADIYLGKPQMNASWWFWLLPPSEV